MSRITVRAMASVALVLGGIGIGTVGSSDAEPKAPEKFMTFCVPCHGPAGKGDGPAAAALNPKPRNFTDGKYMNARTDAQLTNVIKNGSAAEQLSPLMASYGSMLNNQEIKDVVGYIRSLAVPKYQPKK
ncbi:MAG: cytochrome c [candidate division NC10 bacterium]|nr:cytochrome c [candidate division NC10 bacterium]